MPTITTPKIRLSADGGAYGAPGIKAFVSAGGTLVAKLDSLSDVDKVTWEVVSTDETRSTSSYVIVTSGVKGSVATITVGAAGTAGILQATVNDGKVGLTGGRSVIDYARTRTRVKWAVLIGGVEVGCKDEEMESDATYGWLALLNAAARLVGGFSLPNIDVNPTPSTVPIRDGSGKLFGIGYDAGAAEVTNLADPTDPSSAVTLSYFDATSLVAGAGMTGGGLLSGAPLTFNVVANADGSIVVNADDIQVGVLANDAQHGNLGGGSLHADVIASGASGFMTGADKQILDDATPDATAGKLVKRGPTDAEAAFGWISPDRSAAPGSGFIRMPKNGANIIVVDSTLSPGSDIPALVVGAGDTLEIGDANFTTTSLFGADVEAMSGAAMRLTCGAAATLDAVTSWDLQVGGTSRIKVDTTGLGFFTVAPVVKQTVTGSCDGNAALSDLIADLNRYGLVNDSTTAGTGLDITVREDTGTTVTVSATDELVVTNNASPVTVNLPAGSAGRRLKFKNKGGGTATLTPNGSEKLFTTSQVASLAMVTGDAIEIAWDGTDWSVV